MTLDMSARTQNPQSEREPLLGSRTNMRRESALQLARRLGFTQGEIAELVRLYPALQLAGEKGGEEHAAYNR